MSQVVSMEGRITIDNACALRRALGNALRLRPPSVTVDITAVTFMDTSGLATLMEASRMARQQQSRLILRGVQDQPLHLLKVTNLVHIFELQSDADS